MLRLKERITVSTNEAILCICRPRSLGLYNESSEIMAEVGYRREHVIFLQELKRTRILSPDDTRLCCARGGHNRS